MPRKSILLTGGSGFIGRNIVEALGSSYDISRPKHGELDLLDAPAVESYLKRRRFDAVIHAANAGGSRNAAEMHNIRETNFKCFMNMARCSGLFGKMIQLGSGAEYDKSRALARVKESEFGKNVPKDGYGRYKYECSKYIEKAENIVCLRIFGCYGKYEDYSTRFISNAICRAVLGMPIVIENQNVSFSYLYVNDFARIVEHFIEHGGKHKFYNATPDEVLDLLTIASKVKAFSGKSLPIEVRTPGMGKEYSGDNSRLREEMPGFEFTSTDEGIRKLYGWYEQNKDSLDWEKLVADSY